ADSTLFGLNFFGLTEFIASNLLLPIGGFFIAIFVGWVWNKATVRSGVVEGAEGSFGKYPWLLKTWEIVLKYIAPILIFIVLLSSIGLI
ncbi:MAG: sodium-dependent transporter, partial [Bacteroidota bacterium]